ncbi:Zinc finger, CCHC-type [Trema orientale]|uniref:Zinc finger, CCHC-type n=1 Tax=Trema orientale TaxID=63057 RepID=A0A2P5E8S9_TREOI|nr:Zinc finger, CCHC-type [Trema orientale]
MYKFDEFTIRCGIREQPSYIVSRFINGLRPDIRSGVLLHPHHPLEETYQKALEVEEYLRTFTSSQGFSATPRPSYSPLALPPISQSTSGTTSISASVKPHWNKPNAYTPSNSRPLGSQIECHNCHGKGHIASRCPQRTLSLNHGDDDDNDDKDDLNVIVVKPLEVADDDNLGLADDRDAEICATCL